MASDSLNVDLADIEDIRRKLPQAEAILARKRADYESFAELVRYLTKRAEKEKAPAHPRGLVVDLVVEVVDREVREIRARDVRAVLAEEGHDLTADAVSNALYYAAREREIIQQVRRGWYAPKAFTPPPAQQGLASGGVNQEAFQ